MRKLLGAAVTATALLAIPMGGTASAGTTCPTNNEAPAATTDAIAITSGPGVAGSLAGVGYGQAALDTTNLGYTGSLNGTNIGYGDVDGDVLGTGGTPSGSADGQLDGVVSGSGSLSGTTLTAQVDVGDDDAGCVSVP